MTNALRILACASLLASTTAAADICKNHYILLEPISCTWERRASLNVPRAGHTATLLADGTVLVVGGMPTRELEHDGTPVPPDPRTVERYDPATDTWRFAAPLNRGRTWHAATALSDGRVLVVGGENTYHYLLMGSSAEIYDPVEDRWTLSLLNQWNARWQPAASLLPDGRVLVTGGSDLAGIMGTAEIYDPRTNGWTFAGELQVNRYGHSATSLPDGRILFAGGVDDAFLVSSVGRSELYLPSEARFVLVRLVSLPRADHAATLLPGGNVLVSGGWTDGPTYPGWRFFATTGTTQIFDAATDAWRPGPDLLVPRFAHTATLLRDGAVLIVGGTRSFGSVPGVTYATLHSSELRTDAGAPSFSLADLNDARSHHTATVLANGSVLVVGGRDHDQKAIASVELLGTPPR